MGILSKLNPKRKYKKAYGRNKPWSRFNKIGYISDSSTGYTSNSFIKSVNKKPKKKYSSANIFAQKKRPKNLIGYED